MTDNLVARLREFESWLRDPHGKPLTLTSDIFDEAADEIERLRALVRDNGTPRFNAVCERAEKAEAEIERLRAKIALARDVLKGAIDRIEQLEAEIARAALAPAQEKADD
jgi:multidrug resistance efflux pump